MPRGCLPALAALAAHIFIVLTSGATDSSLLVNGDFEAGDTHGWGVTGGALQISDVAHSGHAAQLTSDGQEQNATIFQSPFAVLA